MTTDREPTRIVRSWLQTDEHESAERLLSNVLDRLDTTPQRRPWWRAWRTYLMSGSMKFAAAALAVALVAGVSLAIYFNRPAVAPGQSPSPVATTPVATEAPTPSPSVSQQATSSPEPIGLVAYTVMQGDCPGAIATPCEHRIWTINTDGTNAREFAPDLAGDQSIVTWVPDGSSLYFTVARDGMDSSRSPDVYQALPDGSERDHICGPTGPCPLRDGAFSPDKSLLAFTRTIENGVTTVVSTMDLGGHIFDLVSTGATTEVTECNSASTAGLNAAPNWSPDGKQVVFNRGFYGHLDLNPVTCRQSALFVVNKNDTGLLQLTSDDMVGFAGAWSPDGASILFSGDERVPSSELYATDLYTIRPDGTGMQALTTDGGAGSAHWTTDGGIIYRHGLTGGAFDEVRLADEDGSNETPIDDADLAALTSLGCTICPYAPSGGIEGSLDGHEDAYWQPSPTE
jgi:hypothetical protein